MRAELENPERRAVADLRRRYAIAPKEVQAYLQAEIDYILTRLRSRDAILELGCGYGRVLAPLAAHAHSVTGIDISTASVELARTSLANAPEVHLAAMDACAVGFAEDRFDLILCIQNGLSSLKGDPRALVREAVRITRPGGILLLASYAERFWPQRLAWYEAQVAHGLKAPLDADATGHGVIVGTDGFRSRAVDAETFRRLAEGIGLKPRFREIAGASLFCELEVP